MNKQLILLLLLLPLSLAAYSPALVQFFTGDLSLLKTRGARENKLLLVYFSANWCMPCQWMDKHTFSDQRLAELLNRAFLPGKVDIDEPGGLLEKKRYHIKRLPTLLVIDPRGVVIARYEESLGADHLLDRLNEHLQDANPRFVGSEATKPVLAEAPRPAAPISRPALVPDRPVIRPAVLGHTEYSSLPAAAPATTSASPPPKLRRNYGVQVGVFRNYENTIRQVEHLERRLDRPVNVFVSEHQSNKVYRILVGVFDTSDEANRYATLLGRQSIKGMVKDLTQL